MMRYFGQLGRVIVAIFSLVTVASPQSSDFTYTYSGDDHDKIFINGYIGTNTSIRIPEEIDGNRSRNGEDI